VENKMIKQIQAMIQAMATKEAFHEAVEEQTRQMTKEIMEAEGQFHDYDMDNKEHGKIIKAWIRENPKFDFMAIQTVGEPLVETKLIVLEKGTDKFVAGRRVEITNVEEGSINIQSCHMAIKDGVDPIEFGKHIREATELMEKSE
jgi:hypothetical protein